jgi:hypothetical protein
MLSVTPWEASPERVEAKKIVDDAAARVKTVRADIERIKPKLSTYKKATLEKLIHDTKANEQASFKKNQEYGKSGPEQVYLTALRKQETDLIDKLKAEIKELEGKISEVGVAADAYAKSVYTFRAYGDGAGGGSQGIYARLCEAYEDYMKLLEKELEVASKEAPNAKRTV